MARFRVVRRPSRISPGIYVYDIQQRWFLWWDTISSSWLSLEEAEKDLEAIKLMSTLDWSPKVIKEYD